MRLIYGVGYNDGKYPVSGSKRKIREHGLWKAMLQRCFEEKALSVRPTYADCSVSENFKSYSYFYDWCQEQIGFNEPKFMLDKDLLLKGNRFYHEDYCVFLPIDINMALIRKESTRGDLPIGVYFNKKIKRFVARCSVGGKTKHIASCKCPIEAFYKYKDFKEDYLRTLADEYKHLIDPRAYNTLMNYKVEITD